MATRKAPNAGKSSRAKPTRSQPPARPLAGRVAVVAGSTRSAGRGIARALGEAGATVYCTGRSERGNPSAYGRPETIEETAEMVAAAGGVGVAVRVDHTVEEQVRTLFDRVRREQGRLDILADDVAGQDMRMAGWSSFWETDLADALPVLEGAVLSHVITAKHAAPLMIEKRRGLIVEVTEMDLLFCGGNILAQLVKFSLKGLAVMMAEDLRKHCVAAIAITPGYLRSEWMLEHFGVTEENWREGAEKDPSFLESESPLFLGRAVAALAADPKAALARSGGITSSWEIARERGLTDYDGRRPDMGRYFEEKVIPSMRFMKTATERHVAWLEGLATRGRQYLGEGRDGASRSVS